MKALVSLLPVLGLFGVFIGSALVTLFDGLPVLLQGTLEPWGGLWPGLMVSLGYSFWGTVLSLTVGMLWAWQLYRRPQVSGFDLRSRHLFLILPHLTVGFIVLIVLDTIFHSLWPGVGRSWYALVLSLGLKEGAFVALMVSAVLGRIDKRFYEAARALGSTPLDAFLRVYLIPLTPAALMASLVVFLYNLGSWELPWLFAETWPKPLSVLIYQLWSQGTTEALASASAAASGLFLLQVGILGTAGLLSLFPLKRAKRGQE